MYKVKVSTNMPASTLLGQVPNKRPRWGNVTFFINENVEECDFWIVFEGLYQKEKTLCPPGNTLLITGEPPSIKQYNKKYLKQFKNIITCHKLRLPMAKVVNTQQSLPWHVGKCISDRKAFHRGQGYDALKAGNSIVKEKLISVVISDKRHTTGHRDRLGFLKFLQENLPYKIDVFGSGFNPIDDKWDAISSYKYHLVLENSQYEDYWTEKLADAYLGEAFPIYFGCPNIKEYFSVESICEINIYKRKEALEKIKDVIQRSSYEKALPALRESKNKILDEYNFFPSMVKFVNENFTKKPTQAQFMVPEKSFEKQMGLGRIIKNVFARKN